MMLYGDAHRRTARGYRRPSHAFRESMISSTGSAGRTLTEVVQGQEHFADPYNEDVSSARNSSSASAQRYVTAERYAYMQAGREAFTNARVLTVVADAVHVGSDDWLNVFVYDHSVGRVFICPPQVSCLHEVVSCRQQGVFGYSSSQFFVLA